MGSGSEGVVRNDLDQGRDQWWAVVYTVTNRLVPLKEIIC